MKECICCQCSDHEIGYEPEYFQCESCSLYGTEDDFGAESKEQGEICNDCWVEEHSAAIDHAFEQLKDQKGFTLLEVLIATALSGILIMLVFQLVVALNSAIGRANKVLAQLESTQITCSMVQNGNSDIYKCVAKGGKK